VRRYWLVLLVSFWAIDAAAQSVRRLLFVKYGGVAEVVNPATGGIGPLVFGTNGRRPKVCPVGGYYLASQTVIVSCDDGARFGLPGSFNKITAHDVKDIGPIELKPLLPNGTDDPGPSTR